MKTDPVKRKIHYLKTWPEYYEAILSGDKKHEIRVNDRKYEVGDILRLEEFDPKTGRTGHYMDMRITYISTGRSCCLLLLRKNVVVMSIEPYQGD